MNTSIELRLRAVALIVINPKGEILVLEEKKTKAYLGKYAGMSSPPMETLHRGESYADALKRLIVEELGGLLGIDIESRPRGEYWIADAKATLYVGHVRSSRLPTPGRATDVEGHRWIRPEDALVGLYLRRGAHEMISDYVRGRTGVVCHFCREVSATPPVS